MRIDFCYDCLLLFQNPLSQIHHQPFFFKYGVATPILEPWDPAGYIPSLGAVVLVVHSILVDGILKVTLLVFSQCFLGMVMVSRLQLLQSVVMVMVQPRSYMVQK
jgi:hypothetical protein